MSGILVLKRDTVGSCAPLRMQCDRALQNMVRAIAENYATVSESTGALHAETESLVEERNRLVKLAESIWCGRARVQTP